MHEITASLSGHEDDIHHGKEVKGSLVDPQPRPAGTDHLKPHTPPRMKFPPAGRRPAGGDDHPRVPFGAVPTN